MGFQAKAFEFKKFKNILGQFCNEISEFMVGFLKFKNIFRNSRQ